MVGKMRAPQTSFSVGIPSESAAVGRQVVNLVAVIKPDVYSIRESEAAHLFVFVPH